MSSYWPAFHLPVTVGNSNKWIDFVFASVTYAVGISASTYTNKWTLCSAVRTAINASTAALTVTWAFNVGADGAYRLELNGSDDFKILWNSGTHNASSAYTILGFAKADTANTDEHIATYQAPGMWLPGRAPASDTFDRRRHVGGEGRETLSGSNHKILTVAKPRHRKVSFELLTPEVTLTKSATSTDTNRDFETWWQTSVGGQSFQYFADYTSSVSSGTYYLTKPINLDDIGRPYKDAEYYNLEIEMKRKE